VLRDPDGRGGGVKGNYVLKCYLKGKEAKRQGEKEKGGLSTAPKKLFKTLI
jgi:hypothetical protein